MISLRDFVEVDLTSVKPSSDEANKTVVYIYGNTTIDTNINIVLNASNYKYKLSMFTDTTAVNFINQFFNLGGASLRVIVLKTTTTGSDSGIIYENNNLFLTAIKNLKIEEVAIVLKEASTTIDAGGNYDATGYHYETFNVIEGSVSVSKDGFKILLDSIQEVVDDNGTAFRKLIVKKYVPADTEIGYTAEELVGDGTQAHPGLVRNSNLIWKLCLSDVDLASVLAYLSKVTLVEPETLRDYNFTEENSCADMAPYLKEIYWYEIKDFVNVDIDLQKNESRINIGGNTSLEFDIIQEFESIYISQKLVNAEVDLLKNKINLANAKSVIHSAIINVLETYYKIGYLVQTQYNGSNIYRNIGGKNICILASGEVITGGYKIIILPKASSDVHEFPEIEVIINTDKGIRFIKTTGLVL